MVSKNSLKRLADLLVIFVSSIILSQILIFSAPIIQAQSCACGVSTGSCDPLNPGACNVGGIDLCSSPACSGGVDVGGGTGAGPATTAILSTICGIYNLVTVVIGVLALAMFVLGGLLYGFAHFMPAAGNLRAGMQGWGTGLIIGAIIASVIFILAPFVINTILAGNATINSAISATIGSGYTLSNACTAFPASL